MDSKKPDAYDNGSYDKMPSKGEERNDYQRLRTILDSLEIGALRYYLDGRDVNEKAKRFEELSAKLVPICKDLWADQLGIAAAGCPDGYNNCDGVCVPYSC
jgi:hypothetical protein